MTGVAGAAVPGDFHEAERDNLADCGAYRVPVRPVFDEMIVGAGEPAVLLVLSAVSVEFDLKPRKDPMRGQTENPIRRTVEHLDQPPSERAGYGLVVTHRPASPSPMRWRGT